MTPVPWDGKMDRRRATDHDTLVELVQVMKNHIDNFNIHRDDFQTHKTNDDLNFKRIDKTIYISSGVVIAVVFLVRLFFK